MASSGGSLWVKAAGPRWVRCGGASAVTSLQEYTFVRVAGNGVIAAGADAAKTRIDQVS
jgi:hypothetical protein